MIKIILFLLLTSCSFLIDTYEKDILTEKNITPLDKTSKTYCPIIQKNILINESESSQTLYRKMITQISSESTLSFIDKAVLWSFIQINLRPDQNSPSSKLQVIVNYKNKEQYYNVFSDQGGGSPYFYLLEHLLKKYKSKYSLLQLAKIYDKHMPGGLQVTEDFEAFLIKNKVKISLAPKLAKTYIRGDETLKKNERIPKVNLRYLVGEYKKSKNIKYSIKQFLFKYKEQTSFIPQCNFDMNLYENSIFLISKKQIRSSIFGIKSYKNAFMAVSSQELTNIKPLGRSHVFKGSSQVRSASLCLFKNRFQPKDNIWMISSESRDPGQHLFHLVEYGLNDVKSLNEIDSMLKFSRHLFLKNPVRLVFESKRSDQKQVQELLKLDIPLYNAKSLGKVWSFYQTKNESSFLLDARRLGALSCKSN